MDTVTRSGMKTSEAWGYAAFVLVVLLNGTSWFEIPADQIMMVAAAAGIHGVSRTTLKNTIAKKGTA